MRRPWAKSRILHNGTRLVLHRICVASVCLLALASAASDAVNPHAPARSDAEDFVLRATASGIWARLCPGVTEEETNALNRPNPFSDAYTNLASLAKFKEQFAKEEARELNAKVFAQLLAESGTNITRHGLRISGAIFTNGFDLQNAEVDADLVLEDCVFRRACNCYQCRFKRSVKLEGSTFQGKMYFYGTSIGGDLIANNVTNSSEIPADFSSMQLAGSAYMKSNSFTPQVLMSFSSIGKDLFLDDSVFENGAMLWQTSVGLDLQAQRASFKGDTYFSHLHAGGGIFLTNACFEGNVDFSLVNVADHFDARFARFLNQDAFVSFDTISVGKALWLTNVTLRGTADFSHAQIGRNFECDGSHFLNPTGPVVFADMRVGGAVVCRHAVFNGPVDFRHVAVGDNFRADDTQFNGQGTNDFSDMKVKEGVLLSKTVFVGFTSFLCMRVDGDFVMDSAECDAPVSFERIRVTGTGHLGSKNKSIVNLSGSTFGTLDLTGFKFDSLDLSGLSYQSITCLSDDNPQNGHECQLLLDLYKRGHATHDAYVTLESFYSSQGLRRLANQVYVAGQQVETRKLGESLFGGKENREKEDPKNDPPSPVRDFFLWIGRHGWDILCGYGHLLWKGAIWCVCFIVFGMLIFRDEELMELHAHHVMAGSSITVTPEKEKVPAFSPFWYSVDLFIPLLELGDAKTWIPKKEKPLLRFYRRVHIIAGALLLPITIAALTGLIN